MSTNLRERIRGKSESQSLFNARGRGGARSIHIEGPQVQQRNSKTIQGTLRIGGEEADPYRKQWSLHTNTWKI